MQGWLLWVAVQPTCRSYTLFCRRLIVSDASFLILSERVSVFRIFSGLICC